MRKTLLEIQEILDDIQDDVTLLNLSPLTNKVERVRQLFEGVIKSTIDCDAQTLDEK